MAQVHAFNGTTVNYITEAPWDQPVVDTSLNLISTHNRFYGLTWLANVMPVATWNTFNAARGSVASITTPPPSNPNGDYVTYYGARVDEVTGEHVGLNMLNVRIRFLVSV